MDHTNEIKDRIALKELVGTFSNLADTKEVHAWVQLFTPTANSETFVNGASVSRLTGRDQLEKHLALSWQILKPFTILTDSKHST